MPWRRSCDPLTEFAQKLLDAEIATEEQLDTLSRTRVAKSVHLLSPFDNAVIKRKRIQQLFDSDYQIECFVPAPKRRFGYYCLPIMYGTEIVGRLDPKADRRNGEFILRSLHLEKPVNDLEAFTAKLAGKVRQVATFNQCGNIRFKPRKRDVPGRLLADKLG